MASELQSLRDIRAQSALNPVAAKRLAELEAIESNGVADGSYANMGEYLDKANLTEKGLGMRNTRMFNEAIAPAVKSYQDTIPETQKRFQTERERLSGESARLEDRYKALIDEVKGNQTLSENRQTRATNSEMARRGITNSSGYYDQEMVNAVNPITQQYTSQIKQVGLDREDQMAKIRDLITGLVGSETDATRAITQAIANLQSGAGQSAVAATNQDINDRITQALAKTQQDFAMKRYNEIELPTAKAQIAQAQNKATTSSSLSDLWGAFGF